MRICVAAEVSMRLCSGSKSITDDSPAPVPAPQGSIAVLMSRIRRTGGFGCPATSPPKKVSFVSRSANRPVLTFFLSTEDADMMI